MIEFDHPGEIEWAYAAAPFTEDEWFLDAYQKRTGIRVHASQTEPPPKGYTNFVTTTVRHPFDWAWLVYQYFSQWRGKISGHDAIDHYVTRAYQMTFRDFVEASGEGEIGSIFDSYRANRVMRAEDMPWCAVEFFDMVLSNTRTMDYTWHLTPISVINTAVIPKRDELRRIIVEKEQEFCDRYNYY